MTYTHSKQSLSLVKMLSRKCAKPCIVGMGLVLGSFGVTACAQTGATPQSEAPQAASSAAIVATQLDRPADAPGQSSFQVRSVSNALIKMSVRSFEQGQYKASIALSRQALEGGLSPSRKTAAFNTLCAAYGAQGAYSEALAACDGALSLQADYGEALYNRGLIRFAMGDRAAANTDFVASGISRD